MLHRARGTGLVDRFDGAPLAPFTTRGIDPGEPHWRFDKRRCGGGGLMTGTVGGSDRDRWEDRRHGRWDHRDGRWERRAGYRVTDAASRTERVVRDPLFSDPSVTTPLVGFAGNGGGHVVAPRLLLRLSHRKGVTR